MKAASSFTASAGRDVPAIESFSTVGFDISGGGGNGVYYNSCWIKRAQPTLTYTVLSFRELH